MSPGVSVNIIFIYKSYTNNTKTLCKRDSHLLYRCKDLMLLSPTKRLNLVHKLCVNCFISNHSAKRCTILGRCEQCGKKHHTLVHLKLTSQMRTKQSTSKKLTSSTKEDRETSAIFLCWRWAKWSLKLNQSYRKWCANHTQLHSNIPDNNQEVSLDFSTDKTGYTQTLGLAWLPKCKSLQVHRYVFKGIISNST